MASIVDYLNSKGYPSDFASRTRLAQQLGIQNYTGTADQNIQMLNIMDNGNSASSSKSSTSSSSTTGAPTSSTSSTSYTSSDKSQQPQGIAYNSAWGAYGVTKEVWASLNSLQQTQVSIAMTSNLSNYAANASSLSVQDATAAAMQDPSIISKYADALKIDQTQLTQGIQDLNASLSVTAQDQARQFEQERKTLAEQNAAAGTAYSGFRGKAQENLGNAEAGIVTSSRLQAQQKLNQAQQEFEQKWGTSATPNNTLQFNNPLTNGVTASGQLSTQSPTVTTLTTPTIGGITGTSPVQKSQDVADLAAKNVDLSKNVPITSL